MQRAHEGAWTQGARLQQCVQLRCSLDAQLRCSWPMRVCAFGLGVLGVNTRPPRPGLPTHPYTQDMVEAFRCPPLHALHHTSRPARHNPCPPLTHCYMQDMIDAFRRWSPQIQFPNALALLSVGDSHQCHFAEECPAPILSIAKRVGGCFGGWMAKASSQIAFFAPVGTCSCVGGMRLKHGRIGRELRHEASPSGCVCGGGCHGLGLPPRSRCMSLTNRVQMHHEGANHCAACPSPM